MAFRQKEIVILTRPFIKLSNGQIYFPPPDGQKLVIDSLTRPTSPSQCTPVTSVNVEKPEDVYILNFKSNSYEQAINIYTQLSKDLPSEKIRMEILVPIDILGTPRVG